MMNISLKLIDYEKDLAEFYDLIMNNTDYFNDYVESIPTSNEVKEDFLLDVPPGIALNNKEVYGIYKEDNMIGFVDLLFNYPQESTCMIGYLVIDQSFRKQGIGQYAYDWIIGYAEDRDIETLRLGVIKDNLPAVRMWEKQGFKTVEEIPTEYGEQLTMELWL